MIKLLTFSYSARYNHLGTLIKKQIYKYVSYLRLLINLDAASKIDDRFSGSHQAYVNVDPGLQE